MPDEHRLDHVLEGGCGRRLDRNRGALGRFPQTQAARRPADALQQAIRFLCRARLDGLGEHRVPMGETCFLRLRRLYLGDVQRGIRLLGPRRRPRLGRFPVRPVPLVDGQDHRQRSRAEQALPLPGSDTDLAEGVGAVVDYLRQGLLPRLRAA